MGGCNKSIETMSDIFKTIAKTSEALYKEKMSKFISFAIPVDDVEMAKSEIEKYNKKYFDARHVCWAYMIGHQREIYRSNDNGEPSGTAGKPILGQINSNELTNILIVVIRYFGGVKLGTSGLIVAYREAAAAAIENNEIIECLVEEDTKVSFEYPFMNDIMKIVKDLNPSIIYQHFDMNCEMTLRIRSSEVEILRNKLSKVESATIVD